MGPPNDFRRLSFYSRTNAFLPGGLPVMDFLFAHYGGLLGLSAWGYVIASLVMVQITVFAVTLYLHRDAAHRAVDLHPAIRHFCRFWLWMTTGIARASGSRSTASIMRAARLQTIRTARRSRA
jgi:fatty-acid desaturase